MQPTRQLFSAGREEALKSNAFGEMRISCASLFFRRRLEMSVNERSPYRRDVQKPYGFFLVESPSHPVCSLHSFCCAHQGPFQGVRDVKPMLTLALAVLFLV